MESLFGKLRPILFLRQWNFFKLRKDRSPLRFFKPREDRPARNAAFDAQRKGFFIAVVAASITIFIVFLATLSYLYGSLFNQNSRVHAFEILMVDYDGGVIGQSLGRGYQLLKSPAFPTFYEHSATEFPTPQSILHVIRSGRYWGAIYANPGASNNLLAALQSSSIATTYNATDAFTYVWNEARYPAISAGLIQASFYEMVQASRSAYYLINGTAATTILQGNRTVAESSLQAFLNPVDATEINIMRTEQGTRVLYNTVSMVMPVLMQFFYILALKGIFPQFEVYTRLSARSSGSMKLALSIFHTFLGSLTTTGYIWAFREAWPMKGGQFVLTWMTFWLLMHIHFCVVDALASITPLPALPYVILTWIVFNVTSTVSPFELSPGFYRWTYALPAHEAYAILQDIWSGGAVPQLSRALPIMFVWWILGLTAAVLCHFKTCRSFSSGKLPQKGVSEDVERLAINIGEKDQYTARFSGLSLNPPTGIATEISQELGGSPLAELAVNARTSTNSKGDDRASIRSQESKTTVKQGAISPQNDPYRISQTESFYDSQWPADLIGEIVRGASPLARSQFSASPPLSRSTFTESPAMEEVIQRQEDPRAAAPAVERAERPPEGGGLHRTGHTRQNMSPAALARRNARRPSLRMQAFNDQRSPQRGLRISWTGGAPPPAI